MFSKPIPRNMARNLPASLFIGAAVCWVGFGVLLGLMVGIAWCMGMGVIAASYEQGLERDPWNASIWLLSRYEVTPMTFSVLVALAFLALLGSISLIVFGS